MSTQVKVICKRCGHYEWLDQEPDYDEWKCTLCTPRKGAIRRLKIIQCSVCNQSYESDSDCPVCSEKNEIPVSSFQITSDPHGAWKKAKKPIDALLEVEKGETILRNRVRDHINEKERREANVEKLLIQQNELLTRLLGEPRQ